MGGLKNRADGSGAKPIEVDMEIKPYQADKGLGPDIIDDFEGRLPTCIIVLNQLLQ